MARPRTRSQRRWDLIERCLQGVVLALLGFAVASGPIVTQILTIPQSRVAGVLLMIAGVLFVTAKIIEHRRWLTSRAERTTGTG